MVITDWIEKNQYEIETWEADTKYNFDMCLEAERVSTGLQEVRKFLDMNHMSHVRNPELTDERKARLRKHLPENLVVRDEFEWNCYYNIFRKRLENE